MELDMNKNGLLVTIILIYGLFLSSCLSFLPEGEFTVVDVSDPNPAWVSIDYPTNESTYITNDNAIYLSGSAFVSETYLHGPPWDSGVAVIWNNSLTGGNGTCIYYTEVTFPFIETKWSAYIPLYIGNNIITITAYEYLATPPKGYSRSKILTVTRN